WQLDHEFLVYAAVPDSPVWAAHTRHRQFRPAPKSTSRQRVVSFADVRDGAVVRQNDDEITYSERGNIHGAQFHAIAAHLYEQAVEHGIGARLPTELFLQDIRD